MTSPQDLVASLTPVFDLENTSILPPLNTTPIIVAPLQQHLSSSSSHQTYLLTQRKPVKGSTRPFRERAPWTPEEDNLLKLAVQLYGDKTEKWAKIAACVPGRTNKNCRKRWFHSLDPSLRKGAWTEEEDQLLREGVSKFPNQWSKIAELLPGRTDDQCAKRWRESLDPSIDRSEWTTREDQLLMEKYEEYGSQWQKIAFFFDGRPGLHCRNRWRKLQRIMQVKKEKEEANPSCLYPAEEGFQFQPEMPKPKSKTNETSVFQQLAALLPQLQQQQAVTAIADSLTQQLNSQQNSLPSDEHEYGHGVKPYGCDFPGCHAVFPVSSNLFYHMKKTHPNLDGVSKPYRCAMANCTKKYKNINGLSYHIKEAKGTTGHGGNMTGEESRPYRCSIGSCKKAYRTANGFKYHQQNGHQQEESSLLLNTYEQQSQFRMKREKWMVEGA